MRGSPEGAVRLGWPGLTVPLCPGLPGLPEVIGTGLFCL